jgi:inhibitor of cysteine peptidase
MKINIKALFLVLFVSFFVISNVNADDIEDTSIIDKLTDIVSGSTEEKIKELDIDFSLKSFESCEKMETIMWNYIKNYWKNNKSRWNYPVYRTMGWPEIDMVMDDAVMEKWISVEESSVWWAWSEDFSETNVQVAWVDESDIVKTDWKYIYYYNETDKYVYIVEAKDLRVVKKIKLPKSFYNPVLYIWKNRLTIISSWYSDINYSKFNYLINRNTKTYTIVFDITNIKKPVLSKLYVADWDLRKSRKIGDYIYVISNNNFAIPYRHFEKIDDIKIQVEKILPKKIDISKTSNEQKQNLKLKWKNLPYNVKTWNIAKCKDIEYILPDADTLKKFDFNPSYNIISIIDTNDTSKEVKTKIIAGSSAELYMSTDNMYLTSHMYRSYDFRCSWLTRCIMPWYPRGQSTLIHQISVDWMNLQYSDSTIVPGSPLNQYSMDQHKDKFRIITSINYPERSTGIYVLEKDWLELYWMLDWIEPWEQFKSSRFIGDKLYLVTFKQIDPLFVISMSDGKNPKILWELKIPGYSTYLHPYDENHLIGLWYNTTENKWGGTINDWVKIDLYDVSDFKNPRQKYTYTLWEYWSNSEALRNPRMFMWKSDDNKLFLPATLYKNDIEDKYRHIDFFQWLVTLTVDKDSGIKENFRLTHLNTDKLEEKRVEECMKYSKVNLETKCVKLIWWAEHCEKTNYRYVPKYCYEDSPIWEYISSKSWNYRKSFIKRALWIWNSTYSISDDMVRSSHIDTGIQTWSTKLK